MITGSMGISDIRCKFLRRFSEWGELVPAHKQEKLGVWHPRQSGSQSGTEFAGLITFQCQCQTIFFFKFVGYRLQSQHSHDVFRQLNRPFFAQNPQHFRRCRETERRCSRAGSPRRSSLLWHFPSAVDVTAQSRNCRRRIPHPGPVLSPCCSPRWRGEYQFYLGRHCRAGYRLQNTPDSTPIATL